MSKTTTPPSKERLEKYGVRFVPTNCFSPNNYMVKSMVFPFNGFDTHSEGLAIREASLTNAIAEYLCYDGRVKELEQLIGSVFRVLGSQNQMFNLK